MHYTRETKVGIFVLAAVLLFTLVGFQLGSFRFGQQNYATYILHFHNISGLLKKAEVKIAGVKVGWVENITLIEDKEFYARVQLALDKGCCLYQDAYAVVRQEGILGPTYLELVPGNPREQKIDHGSVLGQAHVEPASLDQLLRSFNGIASDIEKITGSFKQMINEGKAADQVNELVGDVKQVVGQLKDDLIPTMQESMNKIAHVCDRDFSQFADRVCATADMMQDASHLLTEGFQVINTVANDVQAGRGCVGQMLVDDTIYNDIKYTTGNIKEAFARFNNLYFVFDGHIENMFERADNACFKDSKGIFNVRIYPTYDYFYVVGVTTSQRGYITRHTTVPAYTDACLNEICPEGLPEWAKYQYIYNQHEQSIKRNAFRVDLQVGKFYKNVSLRAGLIEGTGGVAADIFIPYNNHYGLISTFKIYDFRGQNRLNDDRPHLKWINRLFLFGHVYVAFGFDDFVSRCNKSFFLGAGFRFGEDELKRFLPGYIGI